MKKTAKIALVLTALLSAQSTAAFAEVSENLKINIDGVFSYFNDEKGINGAFAPKDYASKPSSQYFNYYTRLRFNYKVDPNISFTTRLHSGYSNSWDGVKDPNSDKGSYLDQAFFSYYNKAANHTIKAGKHGAYLGQGLVYNASGGMTGVSYTYGRYDQPTQLQLFYGNKDNGNNFKAIDISQEILPNVSLSATYLSQNISGYSSSSKKTYNYNDKYTSFGLDAKLGKVTLVGERAHNAGDAMLRPDNVYSGTENAYYVEAYTGPTSDMTGGLPYEKVGTEVWSLRYQDIGDNSVSTPTTGMYRGYKGWRLNYGRVLTKGVSGDIAFSHMQKKNDSTNQNCNMVVAELAYKL